MQNVFEAHDRWIRKSNKTSLQKQPPAPIGYDDCIDGFVAKTPQNAWYTSLQKKRLLPGILVLSHLFLRNTPIHVATETEETENPMFKFHHMISVFTVLVFWTLLVFPMQAQEPGWTGKVVKRGYDRQVSNNTPILDRPYRPLHFYGNTVRRMHYKGRAMPRTRDRQTTSRRSSGGYNGSVYAGR